MADEKTGTTDTQLAILAELLQAEISIHGVVVSIELAQKYPAAVLLRNELGVVLDMARQAAASVAALRDLIWLEFGLSGVSDGA